MPAGLATNSQWLKDADLQSKIKNHALQKSTWLTFLTLVYSSLGIIYGDLGTSPLYTISAIFASKEPTKEDILGAMSLIVYTMTLIVLVKYVGIVLIANDNGEGGTFALYSLLCRNIGIAPHGSLTTNDQKKMLQLRSVSLRSARLYGPRPWWRRLSADGSAVRRWFRFHPSAQQALFVVAVIATAMVLGDGVLTPAITVLSAVAGLRQAAPDISQDTIVGVSIAILVLLFMFQRFGTHWMSVAFSPIIVLWLSSCAGVAVYNLSKYGGEVFQGLNPYHIIIFFRNNGRMGWEMLGGAMLCMTGAEAMFADLGHFSHTSVMAGFGLFAYPCLIMCYFGQGAYLIAHPEDASDIFFASVPKPYFWPMLIFATLASVVASQALISGSFSIMRQAMNLGAFPRLSVVHTGKKVEGQIYIAEVNWVMMVLCVAVVAGFKDTVALGNAYGVAVMSVMFITTLLVGLVMLTVWETSLLLVIPFVVFYATVEGTYLSSTLFKVPQGGWFTLAVAFGVASIKLIWWAGLQKRRRQLMAISPPQLQDMFQVKSPLVPVSYPPPPEAPADASAGTAVVRPQPLKRRLQLAVSRPHGESRALTMQAGIGFYYSESPIGVPPVLAHFLRNVQAIHEVSIFMTLRFLPVPHLTSEERLLIRIIPTVPNFYQVIVRYGYQDVVDQGPAFVTTVVAALVRHLETVAAQGEQAVEVPEDREADPDMCETAVLATFPMSLEIVTVPRATTNTFGSQDLALAMPGLPAAVNNVPNVPRAVGHVVPNITRTATIAALPAPTNPGAAEVIQEIKAGSVSKHDVDGVVTISISSSSSGGRGGGQKDAINSLQHALHEGVVYYIGETSTHARPGSNIVHALLYGRIYRLLELLAHSDPEAWAIPNEQLVHLELAIHV